MRLKDFLVYVYSSWYLWNVVSTQKLDPAGLHVCTNTVGYNVTTIGTRIVPSTENVYYCTLFGRTVVNSFFFSICPAAYSEVVRTTVYRSQNYIIFRTVEQQIVQCCQGYLQHNSSCPVPECKGGCLHGRCSEPDTCLCEDFYTGASCTINQCEVARENRLDCGHNSITHDQCKEKGCCWSELEHGSQEPWCFYPKETNVCLVDNGGCQQTCDYNNGNYTCGCYHGYQVSTSDIKKCEDINECKTTPDACKCEVNVASCSASCANSAGGYECLCSPGWNVQELEGTVCYDVNECARNNGDCSQLCDNTPGSYECLCYGGFELDKDNKTCMDINECSVNNGGCEYKCHNTIGSFHCSCKPGFIVDGNGLTCSDHDECGDSQTHGCQQICENFHGSYRCACKQGFTLNADKATCRDVNECKEKIPGGDGTIAGCDGGCINTVGSFQCTCKRGYEVLADGRTCSDIDECNAGTSKCQQQCINTAGLYTCTCFQGYKVGVEWFECQAEPCENLLTLENGQASCLAGVTGDNCTFTCDRGFTLKGSQTRRCQPTHKWNGTTTSCQKSKCPELIPPDFGMVKMPCKEHYNETCQIQCMDRYSLVGSADRKCIVGSNGEMEWDNKKVDCLENTPCHPNPCKNEGICHLKRQQSVDPTATTTSTTPTESSRFSHCDCSKTGYTGDQCEVTTVSIPHLFAVPLRGMNKFEISAAPNQELDITFSTNTSNVIVTPTTLKIKYPSTNAGFQIQGLTQGVHRISISTSGASAGKFNVPKSTIVFVKGGNMARLYNDITGNHPFNGNRILNTGCFQYEQNSETFVSNTKFNEQGTSTGIIHWKARDGRFYPLSISGGTVTNQAEFKSSALVDVLTKTLRDPTEAPTTNSTSCFSKPYPEDYLKAVLEVNAFKATIIDLFNRNSPYWIKLVASDPLVEKTGSYSWFESDFQASVVPGSVLKNDPCSRGVQISDTGFYYLYKTNQTFHLSLPTGNVHLTRNSLKCFMKGMIKEGSRFNGSLLFNILFDDFIDAPEPLMSLNGFLEQKLDHITFLTDFYVPSRNFLNTFGQSTLKIAQDDMGIELLLNNAGTRSTFAFSNIVENTSYIPLVTNYKGTGNINMNLTKSGDGGGSVSINLEVQFDRLLTTRQINREQHCRKNTSHITGVFNVRNSHVVPNTHSVSFSPELSHEPDQISLLIENEELPPTIKLPDVDFDRFSDFQKELEQQYGDDDGSTHPWIKELQIKLRELMSLNNISRLATSSSLEDKIKYGVQLRETIEEIHNRLQLTSGTMKLYKGQGLDLVKSEAGRIFFLLSSTNGFLTIPRPDRKIGYVYLAGQGSFCLTPKQCTEGKNMILHGKDLECYVNPDKSFYETSHKEAAFYSYSRRTLRVMEVIGISPRRFIKLSLTTSSDSDIATRIDQIGLLFYGKSYEAWMQITQGKMMSGGINDTEVMLPLAEPAKITFTASFKDTDPVLKFRGELQADGKLAKQIETNLRFNLIHEKLDLVLQNLSMASTMKRSVDLADNLAAFSTRRKAKLAETRKELRGVVLDIDKAKEILKNATLRLRNSSTYDGQLTKQQQMDCTGMFCNLNAIPGIRLETCGKIIERSTKVHCSIVQKQMETIEPKESQRNVSKLQIERRKICSTMFPRTFGYSGPVKNYRKQSGDWDTETPYTKSCSYKDVQVVTENQLETLIRTLKEFNEASLQCRKTISMNTTTAYKLLDECITLLNGTENTKNFDDCTRAARNCPIQQSSTTSNNNNTDDVISNSIRESAFHLQLLQTKKQILRRRIQNLKSSIQLLDSHVSIAHQNMENAAHNSHVNPFGGRIDHITQFLLSSFSVKKIAFESSYTTELDYPRMLNLFTTMSFRIAPDVEAVTAFDVYNQAAGINDAITAIIKKLLSGDYTSSAKGNIDNPTKRRKNIQLLQNQEKCVDFETALDFLGTFVTSFKNNVDEYSNLQTMIVQSRNSSMEFLNNITINYKKLLHSSTESGSSSSNVFFDLEKSIHDPYQYLSSWHEQSFRYLVNQERMISSRNSTDCYNIHGCIEHYAETIESLVNYEKTESGKLANITGTLTKLKVNLSQLIDENTLTFDQAKKKIYGTYEGLADIVIFIREICGSAPVLQEKLEGDSYHKEGETSNLTISQQHQHEGTTRNNDVNNNIDVTIQWTRDGVTIPNATEIAYVKRNLTTEDSGWYSCQLTNRFGTTSCGVRKLYVYRKPTITTNNTQSAMTLHLNAPEKSYLLCNASDSTEITWFFQPIYQPSVRFIRKAGNSDSARVYEIVNSKVDNSGYYWCKATNPRFSTEGEKILITILPVMIAHPRLDLSMKAKTQTSKSRRSVASGDSSTALSESEMKAQLSTMIGVVQSQIEILPTSAESITFVLSGTRRDQFYASNWNAYAEETSIMRSDLLNKVASFYQKAAAGGSDAKLTIGDKNYTVDADSMTSTPRTPGCSSGFVIMENGFMCAACQPGTRYSSDKCEECDIGSYQPFPAEGECRPCPHGKTTIAKGAKSTLQCDQTKPTEKSTTITTTTATTTTYDVKTTSSTPTKKGPATPKVAFPTKPTSPPRAPGDSGKSTEDSNETKTSTIIIVIVCLVIALITAVIIYVAIRRRRAAQHSKEDLSPNDRNIAGHDNPMFNEMNAEGSGTNVNKAETRFDENDPHGRNNRDAPLAFTNVLYDKGLNLAQARRENESNGSKKEDFRYKQFSEDV